MKRRRLLGALAGGILVSGFSCLTEAFGVQRQEPVERLPPLRQNKHWDEALPAEDASDWDEFCSRFIAADGRVIDRSNHGSSHTESQGLGMLFAVTYDDRQTFDRIWRWTADNLRRGSDALFSWQYLPGRENPVPDTNNATDGDIYIAASLLRAGERWRSADHTRAGQAIARDILALLVREVGGRLVLLPGIAGFETASGATVNLSYYVFPLIDELQRAAPSPLWGRLSDDGRRLIAEARFGRWHLPPDWLRVAARDGSLSLDDRQPPRFSYDAVRIPLFVAWDRGDRQALQRVADFWGRNPASAPAWVDLETDDCAPYLASSGVVAIAKLIGSRSSGGSADDLPRISRDDDYYSAALILLSRIARHETV